MKLNMLLFRKKSMPRKRKTTQGTDLAKIVGGNLKAARLRAGLTQSVVAEALDMEPVSISRIETGAQLPGLDRLEEMAKLLKTPLPALLSRKNAGEAYLEILAAAIDGLPVKEREFIFDFIVAFATTRKMGKKKTSPK